MIEGAGHAAHLERPEALIPVIRRFALNQCSAATDDVATGLKGSRAEGQTSNGDDVTDEQGEGLDVALFR